MHIPTLSHASSSTLFHHPVHPSTHKNIQARFTKPWPQPTLTTATISYLLSFGRFPTPWLFCPALHASQVRAELAFSRVIQKGDQWGWSLVAALATFTCIWIHSLASKAVWVNQLRIPMVESFVPSVNSLKSILCQAQCQVPRIQQGTIPSPFP